MAAFQSGQVTQLPMPAIPARTAVKADPATDSSPSRFDRVLDDQTAKPDSKADPATDKSASGKAADDDKSSTDKADKTEPSDAPAKADSSDPKTLLSWIQGQVAQPAAAPAADPAAATAAPPLPATTPSAAQSAAFKQTLTPKSVVHPGDTPPTRVPSGPAPASLLAAAGSGDDSDDAPSTLNGLPGSGKAANETAALTPTLDTMLDTTLANAVSASANAAVAPASRGADSFQALLSQAAVAASAPAPAQPAAAAASTAAATPLVVDAADLPARLGERLQWLVDSGVQEAQLQLHPRELGSVDVKVRVEAQGTSVWFAAEHPAARAALEAALPQLRERFAADGVALAQTQVASQTTGWTFGSSQQQPQSNSSRGSQRFGEAQFNGSDADLATAEVAASRTIVHVGLIDRYA